MPEIKYIKWGIANTYLKENLIEINEKLKEYPIILNKVIEHEKEHIIAKNWLNQRKVDFKTSVTFKDLFPFIKKHPIAFLQQYFPFSYRENTFFIEWSLLILYLLTAGVIFGIYEIIKTFSIRPNLFWIIIKNMLIIGLIVGILTLLGSKALKSVNKQAKEITN